MSVKHVISVSGGKDSTALLLLALERCPRGSVLPIFCDTGNEHQAVHEYLAYLEQALDVSITRLTADFSREIAAKRRFIALDQRTGRDGQGRRRRWSNKAKRRALAVLHPTGNPFLDLCLWKGRFPYTTLFRSLPVEEGAVLHRRTQAQHGRLVSDRRCRSGPSGHQLARRPQR